MKSGIGKSLGLLGALAMMGAISFDPFSEKKSHISLEDISGEPLQTKPAKGCKEYWFTQDGRFHNGDNNNTRIRKDETVFYCHASNDKNAIRKFNNRKTV